MPADVTDPMHQHRDDPTEQPAAPGSGVVYEETDGHHEHLHVTPFWPMTFVFIALLFFTVLTVVTARYLALPGAGNLVLALAIAIIKGSLVMAYFMHLRYDKGMSLIVIYSTFFAVILFIGGTMSDFAERDVLEELPAQEIYPGGNLKLHAGVSLPSLKYPEQNKKGADMNVVTWAQVQAEAEAVNLPHPPGDQGDIDVAEEVEDPVEAPH